MHCSGRLRVCFLGKLIVLKTFLLAHGNVRSSCRSHKKLQILRFNSITSVNCVTAVICDTLTQASSVHKYDDTASVERAGTSRSMVWEQSGGETFAIGTIIPICSEVMVLSSQSRRLHMRTFHQRNVARLLSLV